MTSEENTVATTTVTKEVESFAHYRRNRHQGRRSHARQIKLGPYLLLQTLGEGEFGKVKLGIHTETGQEFAIKLIRKETVGFSASRLSKVEREIHALRTLKHPYIVKLFNVIETEKYIGIILEYASGGELFEYILAHRCLKEKDAQRLFAQLISSVQYMHRKSIVHRDLKLENLLLDRNRNIVVTDFGFANNKKDGLMATSCGSPCYAAPELVVNEGLYAGSAVDIWSCGVILYAMLCGYLPYDDDPCNPDGNNINQLYRYILSTPPSFPKHVSQEAQDLLRQILVADPEKRFTLEEIQQHAWLKQHEGLFQKSEQALEAEAAVMAEQSFMPNYRKVVFPSTTTKTEDISIVPDDTTEEKNNIKATSVKKEEQPVKKRNEEEWQRPVTVHGAMRRFNMHRRGTISAGERARKTRTVILDRKDPLLKIPARRERLLSFFTGKTEEHEPDETLVVSKLKSKFIASLLIRRKGSDDNNNIGAQDVSPPQQQEAVKKSSSISSISATMGTHNQPQPSQEQQENNTSDDRLQGEQPQQQTGQDEAIALHRQESLNVLTRGKERGQRPRYHSHLGGHGGRIAAVRNSIYRKTTIVSKPPTSEPVWPPKRHSMYASAVLKGPSPPETSPESSNQDKNMMDPSLQGLDATTHQQEEKSVSKKMMAWIKRKSQGNKQQKSYSSSTTVNHQQDSPLLIASDIQHEQRQIRDTENQGSSSPPQASQHTTSRTMPVMNFIADGEAANKEDQQSVSDENPPTVTSSNSCSDDEDIDEIRIHHGAVDRAALTSRAPRGIINEVHQTLEALGIDCKHEGEYKLKCVRRPAKTIMHQNDEEQKDIISYNSSNSPQQDDTKSTLSSLFPNPGQLSAVSSSLHIKSTSSFLSISTTDEHMLTTENGDDQEQVTTTRISAAGQQQPIYGDPSIDSGEEIRFIVEICRFRNLPGLYIADVRRLRGNVWTYKFLYHKLIDLLGLDKSGYYNIRNDPVVQKSPFFYSPKKQQRKRDVVLQHHQEDTL